jgi:broad specificity phosphatase PhoE
MTVKVTIHWYRHAESKANALMKQATPVTYLCAFYKEMGMVDPALSQVGRRQTEEVTPPPVQLVIASHLHRSIETALQIYPTHKIHILCGLNELPPVPTNTSSLGSIAHLSYYDKNRLVHQFDRTKCGQFMCKNSSHFWPEFDKLVREYCLVQGSNQVDVVIVGHAMWLMFELGLPKFTNLERRTTCRIVTVPPI